MIDATKTYNSITEDERLVIEGMFMELFAYYYDKSVNTTGNFSILPREAISKDDAQKKKDIIAVIKDNSYSNNQKLEILTKIYIIPEEDANKLINASDIIQRSQTLAEKLQVGGTQSFISILTDTSLSPEQKRGSLKVLFDMADEKINLLIPTNPPAP